MDEHPDAYARRRLGKENERKKEWVIKIRGERRAEREENLELFCASSHTRVLLAILQIFETLLLLLLVCSLLSLKFKYFYKFSFPYK